MYSDCLMIIVIAICTAACGEGLTYLFVYRSTEYQRLKNEMERKTKKLERKRETVDDKTGKKKLDREEERLKATNRDLSAFKMKSMFAIGLAFTALLSTFSSIFEGRVVAKLPFVPISLVQGISHRNLITPIENFSTCTRFFSKVMRICYAGGMTELTIRVGEDYTDCSFIFLYILCTMTIRANMQKLLGFAPSRAMSKTSGFFPQQNNQFTYLR